VSSAAPRQHSLFQLYRLYRYSHDKRFTLALIERSLLVVDWLAVVRVGLCWRSVGLHESVTVVLAVGLYESLSWLNGSCMENSG
jgi:hypothetical protein